MTQPEPRSYWQDLAVAADNGHLYLDPEAAFACSQACDTYIQKLVEFQYRAQDLANIDGWGTFDSGQELRKMFADKAVGGKGNLVDVFQSHIDVVTEMKVVFNKFFTATQATDEVNGGEIGANGPN